MLFIHDGTIPKSPPKDPNDTDASYGCQWNDLQTGEGITASTWIHDGGITVTDDGFSGVITRALISGGDDGSTYRVTNRVTTNLRSSIDKSFDLVCKEQ